MRRSCRLKQLSGGPLRELPCNSAIVPPARAGQAQSVAENSVPTRELESGLWARGFLRVAGIDEVGRGPLAGPVVACVCIIERSACIAGIRDSKELSAARRNKLYDELTLHSGVSWAVAVVDVDVIDKINILQATLLAMERAVLSLKVAPDFVLVDGNRLPKGMAPQVPCEAVVGGDRHSFVVAAASIIAKVTRDRIMDAYHKLHPEYGFDKHKGYGTAAHMLALGAHGPCAIHRMSFAPMKHMGSA